VKTGTQLRLISAIAIGLYLGAAHGGATVAAAHAALTSITSSSPNANVALGEGIAAKDFGWTGAEWSCEYTLFTGESNWSQYADTRATGLDSAGATMFAYGIGQARGHGSDINGVIAPYPSWAQAANPASLGGSSDPATQIRWADTYIKDEYGTPCSALAAKRASGNKGY